MVAATAPAAAAAAAIGAVAAAARMAAVMVRRGSYPIRDERGTEFSELGMGLVAPN